MSTDAAAKIDREKIPAIGKKTPSGFNPNGLYSYTLPSNYYYDQDVFEKEKENIWLNSWQYFAPLEDVKEPGNFVTGFVADQPIFVVRGKDGALRAFYNVCKHRGHMLIKEEKGQKMSFSCPFHAWNYGLDGQLRGAPNSENVLDFDPSEFTLTEVAVEEFGLWVFVHLGDNPESLASQAGGLLEDMKERIPGFMDLNFSYDHMFHIDANWKFILDGLECYHCPYIHPTVMGAGQGYMTRTFETTLEDYYSIHIGYTNRKYLEEEKDKLPYDFGDMEIKDVLIWFLWPNLVFVSHQGPSNIKILRAVSDGPEKCRREVIGFTRSSELTELDRQHVAHYVDVVWPQDQEAIESQAKGVKARGYTQGRLMVDVENSWASEAGTHHFEHLVWKALNGPNY